MQRICIRCGAPATVRRTREVNGAAAIRDLCRVCAKAELIGSPEGPARAKFAFASQEIGVVLWAVGAFTTCLSLFADWLQIGDSRGFGWRQLAGFVVAGIVVLLAALTRSVVLMAIGGAMTLVALLADRLAIGSSPGFGPRQLGGIALGLGLFLTGFRLLRKPG